MILLSFPNNWLYLGLKYRSVSGTASGGNVSLGVGSCVLVSMRVTYF